MVRTAIDPHALSTSETPAHWDVDAAAAFVLVDLAEVAWRAAEDKVESP